MPTFSVLEQCSSRHDVGRWHAARAHARTPMEIEVVVEIPKGTRNKYEADEHGAIWLDRMLFTATRYPEDYGYVPETLAEDGDPLDAMVLLEEPTFPGCHIHARPVGVFLMRDEEGVDAKVLCVPASDPRSDRGHRARPTSPNTSCGRSPTSSTSTRIWSPASGPKLAAGPTGRPPRPPSKRPANDSRPARA